MFESRFKSRRSWLWEGLGSTPKRGSGTCKGPEAGTCPAQFRNSQEAIMSGAQWEDEFKTGKVVAGRAGPLGHTSILHLDLGAEDSCWRVLASSCVSSWSQSSSALVILFLHDYELEWCLAFHLIVSSQGGSHVPSGPQICVCLTYRMCRPQVGCPQKPNKDLRHLFWELVPGSKGMKTSDRDGKAAIRVHYM